MHVKHEDVDFRLPSDIESSLFRIVQEALINCAKHASAKAVTIELVRQDDRFALRISDDGVGFDPGRLGLSGGASGLGLLTMRERAEFCGGTFDIASRPGSGTQIRVEFEGHSLRLDQNIATPA